MSVEKRKGSPHFQYIFQLEGQRFRGSTGCISRRDAEAVERSKRAEAAAQIELDKQNAPTVPTCGQVWARYWIEHGRALSWAPSVAAHMRESLEVIGADTPIDQLDNAMISKVLATYAAQNSHNRKHSVGTVSSSTVNLRLAVLRQILKKAGDAWEYPIATIRWKTHRRKQPRERVRHISLEQAKVAIGALPVHIKLMMAWSLATGCRRSETESVRWSRINFDTRQAEVETKGGGTRFVELNADALHVLTMCERRDDDFAFNPTNRRKHWEAALRDAGIDDFRWHDLRHTFATWLGTKGAGLQVIQKALGHADVRTTMKYLHVIRGDVAQAVGTLPSVMDDRTVVPMKKIEG